MISNTVSLPSGRLPNWSEQRFDANDSLQAQIWPGSSGTKAHSDLGCRAARVYVQAYKSAALAEASAPSGLAGGAVAALTTMTGCKFGHHIELSLRDRHDEQLRNSLHGLDRESHVAAVPRADH